MNILNNISKITLLIIVILLLGLGIYYHFDTVNKLKQKKQNDLELIESLNDTLDITIDELGRQTAEKQTIRTELNNLRKLEDLNIKLTQDQKKLYNEINNLKNKNNLISAALINSEIKIDSLSNIIPEIIFIDTTNSSILFEDLSDIYFRYSILITNVIPLNGKNPRIKFNQLIIPNEQFIDFTWNTQKSNTPISFRVKNTNPYVKINNVESYAIPTLTKDNVNPSGTLKIWRFIKKHSDKLIFGAAGYGIGKL